MVISRKYKKLLLWSAPMIFAALAYNNCGQSGSIATKPSEQSNTSLAVPPPPNTDSTTPVVVPPPAPQVVYKYVNKSTTLQVGSTLNNKVDVLVVIDNSGSMATEQKNMADRFSTFIDQLNGFDWQVGIVTTDVSSDNSLKDGRLVAFADYPKQYIFSSSMDPVLVKEQFGKTIQRSESGSGDEQGIKATYRTLERALAPLQGSNVNQPNRDLIRNDALLVVLLVTDSNETPPGGQSELRNSPTELFKFVRSSWGSKKNIIFNAIIVQIGDSACLKVNGNEAYGYEYTKLASLTGGMTGTVCASDYGSQLSLIGEKTVDQFNALQLDCAPVDSDKDGIRDLALYYKSPTATDWSLIATNDFTLSEASSLLQFAQLLKEGSYKADYVCQEAVAVSPTNH